MVQSNESYSCIESVFYAIKHFHNVSGQADPTESSIMSLRHGRSQDDICTGVHQLRKKNTPIPYTSVRPYVLEYAKSVGLNEKLFGTHSLRRGGATSAANNGINDRLFQKHGRWKSVSAKNDYVDEDLHNVLSVSRSLGL